MDDSLSQNSKRTVNSIRMIHVSIVCFMRAVGPDDVGNISALKISVSPNVRAEAVVEAHIIPKVRAYQAKYDK
jgi:hypothetical protein